MTAAGIVGTGKYLPHNRVTSENLAAKLKVETEWILRTTGIQSRHFAGPEETASWMSFKASEQALNRAQLTSDEIGLVIACTSLGEDVIPAMACKVQSLLGIGRSAGAFDLAASSAGFQMGLTLASDRLRCEPALSRVLVIGTTVQSPYLDWNHPEVSILFGDGSAAAVVSRVPEGYGILASEISTRPEAYEALRLRRGDSQHLEMDGLATSRVFLKDLPAAVHRVLKKAGFKIEDIDFFLFHQANLRLIELLMRRMKLPLSKTYTNVERYGNTGDASLALALCEAAEKNLIQRGSLLVLAGAGAGCILGVSVLRWY